METMDEGLSMMAILGSKEVSRESKWNANSILAAKAKVQIIIRLERYYLCLEAFIIPRVLTLLEWFLISNARLVVRNEVLVRFIWF